MSYRPKKVLITGGAGFIGCHFVRHMLEAYDDVELVTLDALTYAGHLESLEGVLDRSNHTFFHGSITDRQIVAEAMAGCDAVVNIAAETHVDRSIIDSSPFIDTNIGGTRILLDEARHHEIERFVQISTDEVYGSLPLDQPEARFTESSPIDPRSPYAASKTAADLLVFSYLHTFDIPTIITRCSNNFGPYQYPEKVIPLFTLNLLQGKPVPLYGDGLNVRDWIHVEDHVEALRLVLERGQIGSVYNIGADNEQNNLELTHLLLELTGRDETLIEYVPDRLGHDRRYAMDSTAIQTELGWKPTRSNWPEALVETVEWYRDHPKWVSAVSRGQ